MKVEGPPAPSQGDLRCLTLPKLISQGDLSGAAACFARDACLITQDATAIHDRDRIRPLLAQLIARRTRIEVSQHSLLQAGEVALARERWTIEIDVPEGDRFEQVCHPVLIVQRIEAAWKLALVAPWGWSEPWRP